MDWFNGRIEISKGMRVVHTSDNMSFNEALTKVKELESKYPEHLLLYVPYAITLKGD